MSFRVGANFEATCINFLDHFGVLVNPKAHQKEGCLDVVTFANIHDLARFVRTPGGIKTDGNAVVRAVHVVDGNLAVLRGNLRVATNATGKRDAQYGHGNGRDNFFHSHLNMIV